MHPGTISKSVDHILRPHGLSNVDEVEKNDIGLPTVDGSAEIDMSANAATPRRRIGSPSPKTERYMDAEYLYLQVMIDQI
jgi:hypothetical protein